MSTRRAVRAAAGALIALATAGMAYSRYRTGSLWFDDSWEAAFIVITAIGACVFGLGLYWRVSPWLSGRWENRFRNLPERAARLLRFSLLQAKVLKDPLVGPVHFGLSAAFVSLLAWYTIGSFGLETRVNPHPYLDALYLVLGVASALALYMRFGPRRRRLRTRIEDLLLPSLLLAIVVSYAIDRGLRIADTGDVLDPDPSSQPARFIHILFVTAFLSLIPYTKLFHLLAWGKGLSLFLA